MSTFLFKGDEEQGGLPEDSRVRIESLPKRKLAFSGIVTEALYVELGPGKYAYSVVRRKSPPRMDDAVYEGTFLHELNEDQFKMLTRMSPRMVKGMNTSQGAIWRCQFMDCNNKATSETAAILHTPTHYGLTAQEFLDNPKGLKVRKAGAQIEKDVKKRVGAARAKGQILRDPLKDA